jgi:hypothetical protein
MFISDCCYGQGIWVLCVQLCHRLQSGVTGAGSHQRFSCRASSSQTLMALGPCCHLLGGSWRLPSFSCLSFLNVIMVCLSFCVWLNSLGMMSSRLICVVSRDRISYFFHGWMLTHGVHEFMSCFLHPFVHWWMRTLLLVLGYCESCCSERGCPGVSSFSLEIYQGWSSWITCYFY